MWKKEFYEPYGIEYCLNGRINAMTEDIIKALSESGCREIRMGFESGSFRIRKDILSKPITEDQMIKIYSLCDKYSLNTTSFTMMAIPDEKDFDVQETLRMTAKLKPNLIRLTFCYQFENTPLYDFVIKNNLLDESRYYAQMGYFEESPLKWDPEYEKKLMAYRYL